MPKIIPKPDDYDTAENIPCPNCGDALNRPEPSLDKYRWECDRCGLSVPRGASADGRRILEAYASATACGKRMLQRLFSYVDFGQEVD